MERTLMRATLWSAQTQASTVLCAMLQAGCTQVGITLNVVTTVEHVLAAAAQADTGYFVMVDCLTGVPADVDRCNAIVTRTLLPITIFHPREETFRAIEQVAHRPLLWLPADVVVPALLDYLHGLKALFTFAGTAPARGLTNREQEVHRLFMQGRTTAQIAAQLGITHSTVKTHLANIRAKLTLQRDESDED